MWLERFSLEDHALIEGPCHGLDDSIRILEQRWHLDAVQGLRHERIRLKEPLEPDSSRSR